MKFRTNKIAPLALSVALAFGVAACENTVDGMQQDAEDAEQEIEEGAEDAEEEMEDAEQEMEEEVTEEMNEDE